MSRIKFTKEEKPKSFMNRKVEIGFYILSALIVAGWYFINQESIHAFISSHVRDVVDLTKP